MVIVSKPAAINFCGNLPDFVLTADAPVEFKLLLDAELILEETYFQDASGEIRIDLESVIDGLLSVEVPALTASVVYQSSAHKQFTALIGTAFETFIVLKGGVDLPVLGTAEFLVGNFLTWQPQIRDIRLGDPNWLSYYAVSKSDFKARAYFADSTIQVAELASVSAGNLATVNVSFARLSALFTAQPYCIDVWVEVDGVIVSYLQRYVLRDGTMEFADTFVFQNSLGGIDSICFDGQIEHNDSFSISRGQFDDMTIDYQVDPNQVFSKETGFFKSEAERIWSLEFFKSLNKFHLVSGQLKSVILPKQTLDSVPGDLNGYNFTFAYAKQTKYLQVERKELPEIETVFNSVYYGPAAQGIISAYTIKNLPFSSTRDLDYVFETGKNRIFIIATPPELVIDFVTDSITKENLTPLFTLSKLLVDDLEYNVYKMTAAVNYLEPRKIVFRLKRSNQVISQQLVYFGPSVSAPITPAAIKNLSKQSASILEFDFATGLNKIFTVAHPNTLALDQVYDPVSEEALEALYKPFQMAIDGIAYTVRTMKMAIPYSSNRDHHIILEKAKNDSSR